MSNENDTKSIHFLTILLGICSFVYLFLYRDDSSSIGQLSLISRTFPFIIYSFFFYFLIKYKSDLPEKTVVVCCILMYIFCYFSYLMNQRGTINEWNILVIGYLELPIIYAIMLNSNFIATSKTSVIMFIITALFSFETIDLYYLNAEYNEMSETLTGGYSNSNLLSIFLLFIMMIQAITCKMFKKRIFKGILICEMLVSTFALFAAHSRTSVFCCIIIWISLFFTDSIFKRLSKRGVLFICLFQLVYVFLYIALSKTDFLKDVLIFGKSIYSGRQATYSKVFDKLSGNILLGNYAFSPFENKHNAAISSLATGGIVGASLFMFCHTFSFVRIFKKLPNNQVAKIAYICLLTMYIEGFSEAALFISGSVFAGLFSPIIIMCFYKRRGDDSD